MTCIVVNLKILNSNGDTIGSTSRKFEVLPNDEINIIAYLPCRQYSD